MECFVGIVLWNNLKFKLLTHFPMVEQNDSFNIPRERDARVLDYFAVWF